MVLQPLASNIIFDITIIICNTIFIVHESFYGVVMTLLKFVGNLQLREERAHFAQNANFWHFSSTVTTIALGFWLGV